MLRIGAVACVIQLPPLTTLAQGRDVPSEVAAVMRSLRKEGNAGAARRILRQIDGPVDRRIRDELADSLVAFVIRQGGHEVGLVAANSALDALAASGWTSREGTPYEGAGERLIRIATNVVESAGGALYSVAILADQNEAIERLSAFAVTMNPSAHVAITMLGEMMGARGLAEVRRLFERDMVIEPSARRKALNLAQVHRWARDGSSLPGTNHAAIIMWQLRTRGGVGDAVRILRQLDSTHTRRQRDELADSLTAFVVEHAGRYETINEVSRTMFALGEAGALEGGGIPYSGTADRLVRIARETDLTGGAFYILSLTGDQEDVVRRLRELAVADSGLAFAAVSALDHCCGNRGVAALRALYRDQSVTPPSARHLLNQIASRRGWRKDTLPFSVAGDSTPPVRSP